VLFDRETLDVVRPAVAFIASASTCTRKRPKIALAELEFKAMRPSIAIPLLLVLTAGCVGDDPKPGSSSGGASDAGSGDGGGSVGANLLENPGFEDGCNGWSSSSGNLTVDAVFHGGARSCRVCTTGVEAGLYLSRPFGGAAKVGEKYVASAWLRNAPSAGNANSFTLGVRSLDAGQSDVETFSQQASVLTSSWQEVTMSFEIQKPGSALLRVEIGAGEAPAGSCFLVDDVAVRKL